MGADTFEAREGWVPANTEGSVWCYRTRGNVGVLAFRRTEDGQYSYEATHQDCYASDETITTTVRVDAVRFAVTGASAAQPRAASGDAASRGEDPPELPVAPRPAFGGDRAAMRMAWHQYIGAASELMRQVKANLDDAAHGALLGSVDQALALVHEGALETPAIGLDPVDALSDTIGAVLRKAHELLAADDAPIVR